MGKDVDLLKNAAANAEISLRKLALPALSFLDW